MTIIASPSRARRAGPGHLSWPLVAALAIGGAALTLVSYLLWPTSYDGGSDPDRLPITVGDVLLDVPRQAIRAKVQQRTGAQERLDLAFAYPALTPPATQAHVTSDTAETTPVAIDRIFVTIAAHDGEMAPFERMRTIYPRYLDPFDQTKTDELIRNGFKADSPYKNEDLVGDAEGKFLARCTRDGNTPGTCMSERRIGGADLTFRFPREWLAQWRDVASAIETLTARLVKGKR
jgi:hypothetical protein